MENESDSSPDAKRKKYYAEFFNNLQQGISYYRNLPQAAERNYSVFALALHLSENELASLKIQFSINEPVKILPEV